VKIPDMCRNKILILTAVWYQYLYGNIDESGLKSHQKRRVKIQLLDY